MLPPDMRPQLRSMYEPPRDGGGGGLPPDAKLRKGPFTQEQWNSFWTPGFATLGVYQINHILELHNATPDDPEFKRGMYYAFSLALVGHDISLLDDPSIDQVSDPELHDATFMFYDQGARMVAADVLKRRPGYPPAQQIAREGILAHPLFHRRMMEAILRKDIIPFLAKEPVGSDRPPLYPGENRDNGQE